jgi:hypothetical protein
MTMPKLLHDFISNVYVFELEVGGARTCGSPLEHRQVAIGVAEGKGWGAADMQIDVGRLPLVHGPDFRLLDENGFTVPHLEPCSAARTHHCSMP